MIRGRRESQWLVLRRCLAIVRQLQRGSADSKTLIAAVRASESPDPYDGAEDTRLRRKFEKDLWRIRHRLRIRVRFDRQVGGYRVQDTGPNGLLCLPDHCLHTLAFLYNTFQPEAPEAQRVRSLLDTVVSYLPEEQLKSVQQRRTILSLELRELDEGDIHPSVLKAVQKAVRERRLLQFEYLSPRHDPPVPRQHTVEPYDFVFRQGHYYLDGYCRRWVGPLGERSHAGHFSYRLAYMQPDSIQVLPSKLPPGRRRTRAYRLRYELAPRIARGDISQHFEEMTVEHRQDGWAEVTATITDPFAAAKRLLHYGQHCRVLEPPEVVHIMRDEVRGMTKLYEIGQNS